MAMIPFYTNTNCVSENSELQIGPSYFSVIPDLKRYVQIRNDSVNRVINNRISYLDSIVKIGDNWISGKSTAPSQNSADLGKSILTYYLNNLNFYGNNFLVTTPEIILSPIPYGGIFLEFRVDDLNTLAITISNEEGISFEKQENGFFFESTATDLDDISYRIASFFAKYGYDNRKWRYSV